MKIALVTDAWTPQVNGVVTTLVELVKELALLGHEVLVIHPSCFKTRPCPGYAGIDLAIRPLAGLSRMLDDFQPDAIHLATEGPLGWAGRKYALRRKKAFTTAFHTKFPEILNSALHVPLSWGYALMRHFHRPSSGVMVPTHGVLQMLKQRGFVNLRSWTHGVDTALFSYVAKPADHDLLRHLPRPIMLFVGRVSYEKNIQAFLDLPMGGSKVVCGVGPVLKSLQQRYAEVTWLGILPRDALAEVYQASDVFVFPSRSETFGLVMVEAMAAGTPVAAYPVDGPLEVLARTNEEGDRLGGALHDDLATAVKMALGATRAQARERALDFSWPEATALFLDNLTLIKK
jgi:glycosyltransferase involved in cell wall biosynthesis